MIAAFVASVPATAQLTRATLPFPEGGYIVVQPGDTLFGIARRYDLERERIARLNFLEPPFALHVGQRLLLPVPATHTVRAGETVYRIARFYGLSTRAIIERNDLGAPFTLAPGRTIHLPPPQVHVVREGDTIFNVARRYGVEQSQLVRANELEAPYTIELGARLRIPRRQENSIQQAATAPPERTVPWQGQAPDTALQPTLGPPERTTSRFQFPVRGRVVSRFGPKQGGIHNDGINISTRRGATVVAAEAGTVAYSGSELRGFGHLILIRHEGGWVTAYAHNERLLVREGDRVERGQPVALAGDTGFVDSAQLHFEVRRGRRPLDPMRFL